MERFTAMQAKRFILCTILFILVSIRFYAQAGYSIQERVVGRDFENGRDILATVHAFNAPVYNFDYFAQDQRLLVNLLTPRSQSQPKFLHQMLYDTEKNSLLWQHEDDGYSQIYLLDGALYQVYQSKVQALHRDTGTKKWAHLGEFHMALPDQNILLLYPKAGRNARTHLLAAYDLRSGDFLWQRKVPRFDPGIEMERLDDGKYLVDAAGLHLIDMRDGSGWVVPGLMPEVPRMAASTEMPTGIVAVGYMFGFIGVLVTTGLQASQAYDQPIRMPGQYGESDLMKMRGMYLTADAEGVMVVDPHANKLAKYKFTNEIGARLYQCAGVTLFMLQVKEAFTSADKQVHRAVSAFRCLPPNPEQDLLLTRLTIDDNLLDFIVMGENLYLLFEKSLLWYSAVNGQELGVYRFDEDEKFAYSGFHRRREFLENDHDQPQRYASFDYGLALNTYAERITLFDYNLKRLNTIRLYDLTRPEFTYGNELVFQRDGQVHLSNAEGVILKSLDRCERVSLSNGYIHCSQGREGYQIPIGDFFSEN